MTNTLTAPAAAGQHWVLDRDTAYRLWDQDLIERCKPHYSKNPDTGRIEIDGLTLWATDSQPRARTWARFGDTIHRAADGTCTVHPAT
ncbi:hypothetical protein ACWC5I_42400 [Kitasatospora sp. NPDC001574]